MRVVVVGATGNLGTAVLRRLHAAPEVTGLAGIARRLPRTADEPYGGVQWFPLDIAAPDARQQLEHALRGADAVVHLGWALQPSHHDSVMHAVNVDGTRNVLEAAAAAGVRQVVVASSVGTYKSGPKGRRVDESFSTKGLRRSSYSRHKAENERAMTAFEAAHPDVTVTRLRPGLVFQAAAASEIVGLFLGRWVPTRWMQRFAPPFLPLSPRFVSQVVHADDVADATWRAIDRRAGGAFNLAAEPPVDSADIAHAFRSRLLPVPYRLLRLVVQVTWLLRLQPTEPGWLDIAAKVPVMSTDRARDVLGWAPSRTSHEVLREFADAVAGRTNVPGSPPLHG